MDIHNRTLWEQNIHARATWGERLKSPFRTTKLRERSTKRKFNSHNQNSSLHVIKVEEKDECTSFSITFRVPVQTSTLSTKYPYGRLRTENRLPSSSLSSNSQSKLCNFITKEKPQNKIKLPEDFDPLCGTGLSQKNFQWLLQRQEFINLSEKEKYNVLKMYCKWLAAGLLAKLLRKTKGNKSKYDKSSDVSKNVFKYQLAWSKDLEGKVKQKLNDKSIQKENNLQQASQRKTSYKGDWNNHDADDIQDGKKLAEACLLLKNFTSKMKEENNDEIATTKLKESHSILFTQKHDENGSHKLESKAGHSHSYFLNKLRITAQRIESRMRYKQRIAGHKWKSGTLMVWICPKRYRQTREANSQTSEFMPEVPLICSRTSSLKLFVVALFFCTLFVPISLFIHTALQVLAKKN